MNNIAFYRGPSLLTGDPIVAVATGLRYETANVKTGSMLQTWILRPDLPPMDAVRQNIDDAICGDCSLRGHDGRDRKCYIAPWVAPFNIYKVLDTYTSVSWPELRTALTGRHVRLGAYGDPAALPFEVWRVVLSTAKGWTGYTHAWRHCDPRFKSILMASVDTEDEFHAAHLAGWRTFRVRLRTDNLIAWKRTPLECVCPASDEAGHRTTCASCVLCRGTSTQARSIAIYPHGHHGAMAAFHKSRREAEALA